MKLEIAEVYRAVLETNKRNIILKSGRNAGKSKFMAQMVFLNLFTKENRDIMVTRANHSDLEDTMFSEIIDVIEELGYYNFIEYKKRPFLQIKCLINNNTIYFRGIGGADLSRTRGFKPKKKFSLFVVDEMQQLPSEENLKQATATFRRNYAKDTKVLMAFNPEAQNSHWANEYYRINEIESDIHFCLHVSYLDIIDYLNEADIEEIELEKRINPDKYRHMYLGETVGLFGGTYYTFDRDKHLISEDKALSVIKKIGIHQVLVGVDGAVTRDKTAVVPVFILKNGQCIVPEYFYYDPIRYGAIPDEKLVPMIQQFIEDLEVEYDLRVGHKPIHFVVDSANANLVKTLEYQLPSKYGIWSYSQKKIIEMAKIVQDAFSSNVVFIMDKEKLLNYKTGNYEHHHPLVQALESVIWDEKGKGFDPIVENDTTDALTYALATYFKNPNNLTFPKRFGYYDLPYQKEENDG